MCFTKRCNCGQRVNDVTEGARLDDQDGFGVQGGRENYYAFSDVSASSSEKPIQLGKQEGGTVAAATPQRVD